MRDTKTELVGLRNGRGMTDAKVSKPGGGLGLSTYKFIKRGQSLGRATGGFFSGGTTKGMGDMLKKKKKKSKLDT